MRQRDRDRFIKKAHALIESLGATMGDDDRWHLETKAGELTLSVDENTIGGPGIVFTRFLEPKRAIKVVPGAHENPVHSTINPYSGKWNFHYTGGWQVDDALEDLEHRLRGVI